MIKKIKKYLQKLKDKILIKYESFKNETMIKKVTIVLIFTLIIDFSIASLKVIDFNHSNHFETFEYKSEKEILEEKDTRDEDSKLLSEIYYNKISETTPLFEQIENKFFINKIDKVEFIHNRQDNSAKTIKDIKIFLEDKYLFYYNGIHINEIDKNIMPKIIKLKIPYIYVDEDEHKVTVLSESGFFIFFLNNIFIFLLLLYVIYALEQQGMFGHKDKYKILNPNDIKGNLNDLIGLSEIKEEIEQLQEQIAYRHKYEKNGIEKSFNLLFSGHPGTGKTKVAAYLAKELDIPLIIGTGNVETGYVNGGVNVIKELFETARKIGYKDKKKMVAIFLDEAQTLMKKRGSSRETWADDSANELLAQLDGVNTKLDVDIIFIAASNFNDKAHEFDEAMMRRFQRKIFFPLPNKQEREEIFKLYLNKVDDEFLGEVDLSYLADITANVSPAKIDIIVKETTRKSIKDNIKIDTKTLMKTFEVVQIGNAKEKPIDQNSIKERIAIHEIGHFLTEYRIKEKYNKEPNSLKISIKTIGELGALGYVLNKESNTQLQTRKELEEDIISLFGGIVAEEIFYGEDNVSNGATNDLYKISNILEFMFFEAGLYHIKLNCKNYIMNKDRGHLRDKSKKLYKKTKNLLMKEKELINELKKTLIDENEINTKDFIMMIKSIEKEK